MSFLEDSKMRIATVGAVVSFCVAGAWLAWSLKQDIAELKTALGDSYTLTKASEVALRTAIENPGFRVPDPRDPNKIISVARTGSITDDIGR